MTSASIVNDRQWKEITTHVKLSDTARSSIELRLRLFQQLQSHTRDRRSASELREGFLQIASGSLKLVRLLSKLSEQERNELEYSFFLDHPDEPLPTETKAALFASWIDTRIGQVKEVAEIFDNASNDVSNISRTRHVDGLILALYRIAKSADGFSSAKKVQLVCFLNTACSLVNIGPGSVDEAIYRLQQRGEIRAKKSAKVPPKIAR
ncbi:hypothetical protein ACVME8_007684 [Bradyrhizobium diazoefficiens]